MAALMCLSCLLGGLGGSGDRNFMGEGLPSCKAGLSVDRER